MIHVDNTLATPNREYLLLLLNQHYLTNYEGSFERMFKTGDEITRISLSGTNYKDSKLVMKSNVAAVLPSLKSYLFELLFQILIWGALFFITSIILSEESSDATNVIITLSIICIGFSGIVRFIFYRIRKTHHFDKNLGVYYPGKVVNNNMAIKLSEIAILHLISKSIYSSGKSYTSFELSFCTFDNQRVIIMNHSDRFEIKSDSDSLSKFLGVPCESLRNGAIYK
ncbi:hypothetical protein N9Y67_02735 [Pseudomonadota bacterium]|nr:hypothetical protein [Pseudomonadota bacterium]